MKTRRELRVTFVGCNPNPKNPKSGTGFVPFQGTQALTALKAWVNTLELDPAKVTLTNAYPFPTPRNRVPTKAEFRAYSWDLAANCRGADVIVALGTAASKAATLANLTHVTCLHPASRISRIAIEVMLAELTAYLDSLTSVTSEA